MPIIYLSPSTQESNPYVTGSGSEEYQMNLLADALEPYLLSNGIRFVRNRPDMTAASSIRESNEIGGFGLHLALHSNASGEGNEGNARGVIAFYYPASSRGKYAAQLLADELRQVYPLPQLVYTRATTSLGEVRRTDAPAVLLEIGYHDNYDDATWIETSRDAIAQAIARALTEYFDLPFIYPQAVRYGVVSTAGDALLLHEYPSAEGAVLARMPDGSEVSVYGEWEGWYVVHFGDVVGYAAAAYIAL